MYAINIYVESESHLPNNSSWVIWFKNVQGAINWLLGNYKFSITEAGCTGTPYDVIRGCLSDGRMFYVSYWTDTASFENTFKGVLMKI